LLALGNVAMNESDYTGRLITFTTSNSEKIIPTLFINYHWIYQTGKTL